MITIACVRTGDKYGVEYVERLRDMVERHLRRPFRMICLTDQPDDIDGVFMIDISEVGLGGWWAKMLLFCPEVRGHDLTVYFDLDTVIINDLDPLISAAMVDNFSICENFTKLSGHPDWPCSYGSCVMTFAPGWGNDVFIRFMDSAEWFMEYHDRGDQQTIEFLHPGASYLQNMTPPGYFVGRRDFTDERPDGAAIMVFAGRHKPHNTPHQWLREAWVG